MTLPTTDGLRDKVDAELKEIFEQPVVRKKKVDALVALIEGKQREARIETLTKAIKLYDEPFGEIQRALKDTGYTELAKLIAEIRSKADDEIDRITESKEAL